MRILITLISLSLIIGPSFPARAATTPDPEVTRTLCNLIIKQIYKDIEQQKPKFPDLELYNLIAFKENEWGYNYIKYQYVDIKGSRKVDELAFRVEFVPIDVKQTYDFDGTHLEYPFPILNLKLLFYQNDSAKQEQIEVLPFVKRHARKLLDYQTKFMPVKFRLYPEKEVYRIGEDVTLVAELDNTSSSNIKLKDLSSNSVAMTDDLSKWGFDLGRRPRKAGTEMLRPNGNLKRKFRIGSFKRPQTKYIHAIYLMEFLGAEPTVTTQFEIVE